MNQGKPKYPEVTLTVDEFLMLDAAQKVAGDLGFTMTWEKTADGLIIGMGKSNGKA